MGLLRVEGERELPASTLDAAVEAFLAIHGDDVVAGQVHEAASRRRREFRAVVPVEGRDPGTFVALGLVRLSKSLGAVTLAVEELPVGLSSHAVDRALERRSGPFGDFASLAKAVAEQAAFGLVVADLALGDAESVRFDLPFADGLLRGDAWRAPEAPGVLAVRAPGRPGVVKWRANTYVGPEWLGAGRRRARDLWLAAAASLRRPSRAATLANAAHAIPDAEDGATFGYGAAMAFEAARAAARDLRRDAPVPAASHRPPPSSALREAFAV